MELVGNTVADRFEIVEKLQSGYFGQTWLAVNRESQGYVCLKTFFSENISQRKELDILKQLCDGHFEHENVCKVLDVSTERAPVMSRHGNMVNSVQYVVFEFCRGSDLFNFLCTGPWEKTGRVSSFSERIARHYFKQVVLGVMYLHERGVFHRDIKPENCVIDDNFNLKLTDFGTNKIFSDSNPMQVLRTKTRGVGTESYRAPEVNSGFGYDPSLADVWSLGVMLFFIAGIEHMWQKAQSLDPYVKQIMAPLGILFPFPIQCSKLDSYLRRDMELRSCGLTGSIRGNSLNNDQFWLEWVNYHDYISLELRDLLNRIFVMEATLRLPLRDILRHPWMNVVDGLSSEMVQRDMMQRCPKSVKMSSQASPKVLGSKLLGGVDQSVLRDTLSGSGREHLEFPEDSEIWIWSNSLQHLESIQLLLAEGDLQELVIDIGLSCELLNDVLQHPYLEKHRTVFIEHINSEWIVQLLLVVGFLPHGHTLFLCDENLDLFLLNAATTLLRGMEFAIMRSIFVSISIEDDREGGKEDGDIMDMESELVEEIDMSVANNNGGTITATGIWNSIDSDNHGGSPLPLSHLNDGKLRSLSQNENTPGSFDAHMGGSSQGSSAWASMSSQSSQEELPESLQLTHDWYVDFTLIHQLIQLNTSLDVKQPKQFKGSSEFCKVSGLLCSYGLYQVVCHEQLVLYCRGNSASFSVRLVQNVSNVACVSTWCFCGRDEWTVIFERLCNDLTK